MMQSRRPAPLPPRWYVRAAWVGHRAIYSITGGRRGLRRPTAKRWGMLRLRTVGRHTGEERTAILGTQEQQDATLMLVGSFLAVVSLLLTGVTMSKTTPVANPTLPEGTVVEVLTPEGQPNRTAVVV